MSGSTIDYGALAKQYGGEPAEGYDSLAKKYGGEALTPPAPAPKPAPAPQPDLHALATQHGGVPLAVQAEREIGQGQTEGWMPRHNQEQLGTNPLFRPGEKPALNSPYPGNAPKVEPPKPADLSPQEMADQPPAPAAKPRTMAVPNPKGLVEPGNLPIDNRPTIQNADGTHSSEYSVSFNQDGKEVLVPTVVGGRFLTPDGTKPPEGSPAEQTMFREAWKHYLQTGQHLGKFDSIDAANAYADVLHNRGNKPSVGPADMSQVAGAAPGTPTPQSVAGVQPNLPAPTKAQGAREGWMPGEAEREQFKPVTDFLNQPLIHEQPAPTPPGEPSKRPMWGKLPTPQETAETFRQEHPVAGGVVRGVQSTAEGLTTPANLAMLAALPESKVLSAFFAAQAAHGAYKSAEDAYQAFRQGKNGEAAQYITEAGLGALIAALAGYHAAAGHGAPRGAKAEAGENVPRGTNPEQPAIGATEPETDRPILQQSPHPEVNQAAATAEHPIVKTQLEEAIKPVQGAKLAGARDEKTPERVEEKIEEEGQSPRTIRDYSGYRIAVDTPEAKSQVVQALKKRFEVPNEQDEFEKGNEETGFHGHTLQVREPGSPVSHEVQILPREVAETANERHGLYEKAREGDKDAAAQVKAANEADWERFQARLRAKGEPDGLKRETVEKTTQGNAGGAEQVPPNAQTMPAAASSAPESTRPWSTESVTAPEGTQERVSGSQSSRLPSLVTRSIEPSSVNEGGMKLGSIEPASRKIIQQPPGSHTEQMQRAKEVAPEFAKMLDELGNQFHAEHTGVNLKSEPRILEKLAINNRPPETVSDYIRARMALNSIPELRRAVQEIEQRYGAHQVEDFLEEPKNGAYRAVHLQIHLPNGQSAELQLVPKEIYDAQEDAHKNYEVARSPNATPEEREEALREIQRKLGTAWDRFEARTGGANALREPSAGSVLQRPQGGAGEAGGGRGRVEPLEQRPPAAGAQTEEVRGTGAQALGPGEVGRFPVSELKFDPRRFQYKLNTDEGGTTNLLKGQRWNPDLAGVIGVWRDPKDNSVYVVNGHHRAQLAKSNNIDSIDVRMLNADTPEQARTIGALQNIAEGRGTPIDAAKFFRDTGLTADDLAKSGISLGEATARNGMALSRLDPSLFDKVVNGTMRLGRAIAIGDATDVPEQQEALVKLIQRAEMKGRRVHDDTIEELARMVKGAGESTETQQTLFGAQEMRKNLALEKAEISSYVRDAIGKEKRLFQSVADENKAGRLAVAGNKIEASKNAQIAQKAGQAQELYDRLSTRTGPVDEILNRAARELAEGKGSPNAIKSRAYDDIRQALSQAFAEGQGNRVEGSEGLAPAQKVTKNSPVILPDGRTGVVQFLQPAVNGGPALARVRASSGEMLKSVRADSLKPIVPPKVDPDAPWIGVDLDKTMAQYKDFKGPEFIGKPIPEMIERIRNILKNGEEIDGKLVKDVRVFTARVADDPNGEARAAIEAWTQEHLGQALPVTNIKDPHMVRQYDDRAVQVEGNTGKVLDVENVPARPEAKPAPVASAGSQAVEKGLLAAKSRTAVENVTRARAETTTLKDAGDARVTVLNPDGYHILQKLLTPDTDWKGAALDPASASRWIAKIRSFESRLRVLPGMKPAAEAAKALALDLDEAREPDGSLLLLRPDHDEATVREEMAHRWQNQTGLRSSAAMREVAARPEFEQIAEKLKAMGYDQGAEDQASELVAKALAGDPDMQWTPEQQNAVVLAALKAAVDEHGPEILNDLPPADPAVQPAIEEAKRYAQSEDRGNGGTPGERLGQPGEREARANGGQPGGPPHEGEDSAYPGRERGVPQGGAPESKLDLFKRLTKRLAGEQPLPGMEENVKAQDEAAAEQRGRDLTTEMLQPGRDISRATGEMERTSPLFRGTEANPQGSLFKVAERPTTVTTGKHDTGRSLDEMIEDLSKAPERKMSMEERIAAASDLGLRGVGEVKDKLDSTWGKVKGSTAGIWNTWNRPAPWTNFFESLKGLRQAEFRTALDLDDYQKELKRVAPSQREREAMTVYGEAENDQQLRRWASQADHLRDKRWANAFKDALHLSPQQKAIATAHRRYYDQQLQVLTDAGLLPAGATRYVMHMFTSDPATLQQLRSITDFSELATDPSFLKRRVYKNYFEAIANGEKPKTLDAGLILGAYHDAFAKTFMTRSFLRSLLYATDEDDSRPLAALESRAGWTLVDKKTTGESRILKQPKRPEDLTGYVRIPASQLRNFTWEMTDADRAILAPGYDKMPPEEQKKLFGPDDPRFPVPNGKILAMRGDLLIHPKYADRVSDLVSKSWFDRSDSKVAAALKGIQKAGAVAKSTILTGSLFHQVQLGVHAMEHLVNPFRLPELKTLAKDPVVLEGVGHGLNLLSVDSEGVLSDLPGMATYHRYLFRDYIPRLKAQMYKHAFERNMERYSGDLTRDEIHLMTAKQANAAFGGLDPAFFEKLHRQNNRTWKAIEHMVLFSPDFTKARAQFVAQALGKYGKEQRYALLRGALVIYGGARIANAILNNGDAKWKPQDALSVVTPKSWGAMGNKRLSLRTVQGDLVGLLNDPVQWSYNRLNPVTLRPTIEFLTGRDNFGRQETKAHFLKDYAKQLAPIPVQKLFTTSEEGLVSSLFTSAGLQTGTYRTPLEKRAHEMRISNIPDNPEDEAKQDEQRRNVQMVEKIRRGDASTTDLWNLVNQGKMTAREASAIVERAQMTELQYDVHHLTLPQAIKIYEAADASERAELHDILEEKRATGLKNLTDEAAEKLDKQLNDLGIQ